MEREAAYYPYRSNLLEPKRVRELSKLSPIRPIFDSLLCWSCIIATWVFVAYHPQLLFVLLAIPIVGNRYYALFIIGHDGFHKRIFDDLKRNDLFADLFIYGPIGAITHLNKRNHLAHHTHLATEEDPDRHKHCCFNKVNFIQLIGYLTGLSSVLRSVRNVFLSERKPTAASSQQEKMSHYTKRDLLILGCWQLVLIIGLSTTIGWWAYPVLWLFPVYCFSFLADNLRSFAEHSQPYRDTHADEHRLITYLAPWWERVLLAPMNMNFHAVHHLWPSIPYYNLPHADREIRAQSSAQGLEWRDSYLRYLTSYFRKLPLEECRKNPRMPEELESIAPIGETDVPICPVCSGTQHEPYTTGYDYESLTCKNSWQFVRCAHCTHVWLSPRPAVETLPVIYPKTYYAYNYEQRINRIAVWGKEQLDRLKFGSILRYRKTAPKSYLDIGCGNGRSLRYFEKQGIPREQLFGLELDEAVVERLARDGYRAYHSRIESTTGLPQGAIDLATMFHVIEHLADPTLALQKIHQCLSPDGVLALETPNIESLDARLFRHHYWGGYHFPRHWQLFTPKSITELLQRNGFEVIGVKFQTGHSFWMFSFHHILRYACGSRKVARWFDPFRGLPLLVTFTAFDKLRALLGAKTSAMLVVAKKR